MLLALATGLAGCDRLPIPDPGRIAAQKELDSKAVGGACRHAGRALEDCYTLNPKASKAAIFAGWREMNDYMSQNKIEVVLPTIPSGRGTKNVAAPVEIEAPPASPAVEHDSAHSPTGDSRNPALTAS